MAEENSQVSRELLKGGQGILCLDAKLCIGMPASHYKHKIQDIGIVGLWQDAIKHWQDALGCGVSGWLHYLGGVCLYLEKVFIVVSSKLLHLGCIANEAADPILPEGCDKSEPAWYKGLKVGQGCGGSGWLPFIKGCNGHRGVELEYADDVCE